MNALTAQNGQHITETTPEELSPSELTEATKKLEIIKQVYALGLAGYSQNQAALELELPRSSVNRWIAAWEKEHKLSSLVSQFGKCGRKPLAKLTRDQKLQVQQLAVKMSKNTGHKVVTATALRVWATTEHCPDDLREIILADRARKRTITPTLKRQARVTPELLMHYRGDKNLRMNAYSQPRKLTYINAHREEVPILAGDFITWDDAHWNTPFFLPCDDPSDPCAARFGVRAFRAQNLLSVDIGTGRALTSSIVARHSDAYNQRDILWTFKRFLCAIGKPIGKYLEHGAWASGSVAQALHNLGIEVHHAETAKGKAIVEKWFDWVQTNMTLAGVPLGRQRGEFDWANKDWLAVRAGRLDPRKAGYIPAELFHEKATAAANLVNSEKMEGELYHWVPDEKWLQQIREHPLKPMTIADTYVIAPEHRVATIRNGHVRCQMNDCRAVFYFSAEWFAELGTGYKVYVCFDTATPEAGAAILNREESYRARDKGVAGDAAEDRPYRPGELIGVAQYVERVPMFCGEDGFDDTESFERRKRYLRHVRLMFREIMPFGRGIPARADERRDGRGLVERTEITTDMDPGRATVSTVESPQPAAHRRSRAMGYEDLLNVVRPDGDQPKPRESRALSPEELLQYVPSKGSAE